MLPKSPLIINWRRTLLSENMIRPANKPKTNGHTHVSGRVQLFKRNCLMGIFSFRQAKTGI